MSKSKETTGVESPAADVAVSEGDAVAPAYAVVCVSRDHYESLVNAGQNVAALKSDAALASEKVLRMAAEMDNLKKRLAREKEEVKKFANESFAEDIVAAMDNFELGIQAAASATDPAAIAEGMKMAMLQLTNALRNHGLTPIEAEGQPFDPNYHEALQQEERSDVPDHTVLRQLRRGWKYHDRLLRPASVVVSQQPTIAPVA